MSTLVGRIWSPVADTKGSASVHAPLTEDSADRANRRLVDSLVEEEGDVALSALSTLTGADITWMGREPSVED